MISFILDDSLVYNNIDKPIRKFVIKQSGVSFIILNDEIVNLNAITPIDTKPAETPKEFLEFIDSLNRKNGKRKAKINVV